MLWKIHRKRGLEYAITKRKLWLHGWWYLCFARVERAELLDGEIYDMAPPTSTHPFMLGDLHYSIRDFILNHKGSCQVAMAPFAVFFEWWR